MSNKPDLPSINDIIESIYNPELYPLLFLDQGKLSEEDLCFNEKTFQNIYRIEKGIKKCELDKEKLDVGRFSMTLGTITMARDPIIMSRSFILMFLMKDIIDFKVFLAELPTQHYDLKAFESSRNQDLEAFFSPKVFLPFYNEIKNHQFICKKVADGLHALLRSTSYNVGAQYKAIFEIIYRVIDANDNSIFPLHYTNFNFLTDEMLGDYFYRFDKGPYTISPRTYLIRNYPLILPLRHKIELYHQASDNFLAIGIKIAKKLNMDELKEIILSIPSHILVDNRINFVYGNNEDTTQFFRDVFNLIQSNKNLFVQRFKMPWFWIKSHSSFNESLRSDYRFFGIILGLAYKSLKKVEIPMSFPVFFFKKLLGKPIQLSDLFEYEASLANNYLYILEKSANVFRLTFDTCQDEFHDEEFNLTQIIPQYQHLQELDVTDDNKIDFVNSYINYIFNYSVENEFSAILEGFYSTINRSSSYWNVFMSFHPYELSSMINPVSKIDIFRYNRPAQCPLCHMPIERSSGCNHLVCGKCVSCQEFKSESCKLCQRVEKDGAHNTSQPYGCGIDFCFNCSKLQLRSRNHLCYKIKSRENVRTFDRIYQDFLTLIQRKRKGKLIVIMVIKGSCPICKKLIIDLPIIGEEYPEVLFLINDSETNSEISKSFSINTYPSSFLIEVLDNKTFNRSPILPGYDKMAIENSIPKRKQPESKP